ncbi:MAG TPA: AmmeMemoRadiSam system radical SAM enzyme [Sedimentisphaerales bacterium]|nr:AmmeMemoRadiSam system radical SAM enzyme [Sedimentisphaerales bacterium]
MGNQENIIKEAILYERIAENKVQCNLCSFRCKIPSGGVGHCFVRKNIAGKLYSLNYGRLCAANIDPIEKKPLFHFQPGSKSFSVASPGCNFRCDFCQNWQISQMPYEEQIVRGQIWYPDQVIAAAIRAGCKSIAYTYTEPTVFMEFCDECGRLAKQDDLKNVFVSNGYMTRDAIKLAAEWLDAINVDLKSFSDYYKKICKANLQPVLDAISYIAKETDIWLEITTLIVPGQNDGEDELKKIADFIVTNASADVPWHVSRFYPNYKYLAGEPTPVETLEKAYKIGKAAGLKYVYVGNIPGAKGENTFCHNCGKLLIERVGFQVIANRTFKSCCPECHAKAAGFEV